LDTIGPVASLSLQVLDAASQSVLRRTDVKGMAAGLSGLIEGASHEALVLLDLPEKEPQLSDEEELKQLPAEAFKTFSEAESLASDPSGEGLSSSIGKYEQVLAKQPNFALGYARLAIVYARLLHSTGTKAFGELATQNANTAVSRNAHSPTVQFSLALASLYTGDAEQALTYLGEALQTDPNNPDYRLYQAQAYRDLKGNDGLKNAADVYERIIKARPNYWPVYNEYGFVLAKLKRYTAAEKEFEMGALVAPNVAAPLANLASMYFDRDDGGDIELRQKNKQAAIDACNRSLARHPNDQAYLILGDCAFEDHKYDKALAYYQSASQIDPNYHMTWRNIGDCYEKKGQKALVQKYYAKAADTLARFTALNPSRGDQWATLAFYHAKIHDLSNAQKDIDNAQRHSDLDVDSQLYIAQALVLMNRREEALSLLLKCMEEGLSPVDVDNALDLASLQKDPRYLEQVARLRKKKGTAS
jgi:eukaryotic-like serine/threonine-protein kinase